VRLSGAGKVGFTRGLPPRAQPLSVDLHLAAHGKIAELLAKSGLPMSPKDKLGFTTLEPPIHFGGSLERIDADAWHDLLADAATRKPDDGKKGK
jgi:hypothetical protein